MTEKKRFLIAITALFLTMAVAMPSALAGDNPPKKTEYDVPKNNPEYNGKPLAPSRDRVTFVYDSADGTCTFSCTREFLHMDVDIVSLSGGESYSETITAEYPVMYAPLSRGEYHIICVTDDSATYSGDFTIE